MKDRIISPKWQTAIAVAGAQTDEHYGNLAATNKTYPIAQDFLPMSLDVAWTGDPVGSFLVEGTNGLAPTAADPWATKTGWHDVAALLSAAIPNTTGVPGAHAILVGSKIKFKHLRLTHTRSSGSGTMIVKAGRTWA
jgi:hypothetical protein